MFLLGTALASFFKSTKIAAGALYGDFTFKAYYNFGFHLDAITSFVCHVMRTLYNLACLALRVIATPFYIINPFLWFSIPEHCLNIVDNAVATIVSAATVTIHPLVVFMRTLTSLFRGYEQDTDYDQGIDEEQENLALAITIFSYS